MKRIYGLLLVLVFAASSVFAADKVLFFDKNTSAAKRAEALRTIGAKVKVDFPELNAVAVKLDKEPKADPQSLGIEEIEDDAPVQWLKQMKQLQRIGGSSGSSLKQIGSNPSQRNTTPPPLPKPEVEQAAGQQMPWGIERVKAPQAWAKGLTGKGVLVAVVDSGVQLNHPDLKGNIAGKYNAIENNGNVVDGNGHGTHVAGTIAAMDNDFGVVGVAPQAKILAVQVISADGFGSPSSVANGVRWAAKNGAQVINMSLGSPFSARVVRDAVNYAVSKNIVVICASGNGGGKASINFPAALKNTIAVSASMPDNKFAPFSDISPQTNINKKINFIAPGVSVASTYIGSQYASLDGTSMASPHVAGLAALAVQAGASTPTQVLEALKRAAKPLPGVSTDQQGSGFIDASKLAR